MNSIINAPVKPKISRQERELLRRENLYISGDYNPVKVRRSERIKAQRKRKVYRKLVL